MVLILEAAKAPEAPKASKEVPGVVLDLSAQASIVSVEDSLPDNIKAHQKPLREQLKTMWPLGDWETR